MLLHTTHPSGKTITIVDMRSEKKETLFCEKLEMKLSEAFQQGKRVLIMWSKANFSSGMICTDCGTIPQCNHCSIPVWRHKDTHGQVFGLCHLCKTYYPAQGVCSTCKWHAFQTYGYGLQFLAEQIKKLWGIDSLIVDRTVANSLPKIEKLMEQLQWARCILSTSLLTQPPANLPLDLVIVTHADTWLQSPDLYASRRNYCFLSELCSKYTCPELWLHTYNHEQPSIQYAVQGNHTAMLEHEDAYRKRFFYPPYSDLCVLLYKHEIENRVYTTVNKLYQELLFLKSSYQQDNLEIYSTPPLIYKAFGKFRYHIVLKGENLRPFLDIAYSKLKIHSRGFKVDWEPQNLI